MCACADGGRHVLVADPKQYNGPEKAITEVSVLRFQDTIKDRLSPYSFRRNFQVVSIDGKRLPRLQPRFIVIEPGDHRLEIGVVTLKGFDSHLFEPIYSGEKKQIEMVFKPNIVYQIGILPSSQNMSVSAVSIFEIGNTKEHTIPSFSQIKQDYEKKLKDIYQKRKDDADFLGMGEIVVHYETGTITIID